MLRLLLCCSLLLCLSACDNTGSRATERDTTMTDNDYAAIVCTPLDQSLYPELDEQAEKDFRQAFEMETPKGIPIDFAKVARLYQNAVDKGHWKAMNNLSILYLRGLGVEQSPVKSVELIAMMAELNIPEGHMAFGLAIDEGRGGLTGGREKALEHYAIAARQGHPRAQTIIGKHVLYNLGNKEKGLALIECALSQQYADAAWELGVYFEDEDFKKTIHYYREGAKLGQKNTINQLMNAYEDGRFGLNKDHDRALCFLSVKRKINKDPSLTFPNLDELCPSTVKQPY